MDSPAGSVLEVGLYLDRFQLVKVIGEGSYGKVKLALDTKFNNKQVALKIITKDKNIKMVRVKREIRLLRLLHHPHIVQLYDVFENDKEIVLSMEHVQGGELFNFIVAQKRVPKAIRWLTSSYASPEMVLSKQYVGPEVDVWSLGVILFALLSDQYSDIHLPHLLFRQYTSLFTSDNSQEAKDLIRRILVVDPTMRYTMLDILAHPWTNEFYDFPPDSFIPYRETPADLAQHLDTHILTQMEQFGFDSTVVREQLKEAVTGPALSIYYLLKEYLERMKAVERSGEQLSVIQSSPPKVVFAPVQHESSEEVQHLRRASKVRSSMPATMHPKTPEIPAEMPKPQLRPKDGYMAPTTSSGRRASLSINTATTEYKPPTIQSGRRVSAADTTQAAITLARINALGTVPHAGSKRSIPSSNNVTSASIAKLGKAKGLSSNLSSSIPLVQPLGQTNQLTQPLQNDTLIGTRRKSIQPSITAKPDEDKKKGLGSSILTTIAKAIRPLSTKPTPPTPQQQQLALLSQPSPVYGSPKPPRTAQKTLFLGSESVSSKPLQPLCQEIQLTLTRLQKRRILHTIVWNGWKVVCCNEEDLKFTIEVCVVAGTGMHVMEFVRVKGLTWEFHEVCREVLESWAI